MSFVFQVQAERMQALQVLSLTLLSVLAVSAQSIGSGKCPEPPVQQNFDPTRVNFFLYTVKKKFHLFKTFPQSLCGVSQVFKCGLCGVFNML